VDWVPLSLVNSPLFGFCKQGDATSRCTEGRKFLNQFKTVLYGTIVTRAELTLHKALNYDKDDCVLMISLTDFLTTESSLTENLMLML
jgi:hypothetical protein